MECGWYFHSSRFPLKVWIIGNLFIKSIAVTGGPSSLHWRTRSWLLLFSARMVLFPASGVVLQRLFTKACTGCKRFFLKARKNQLKNVMFLNKIDLPYCLVVFFVVCSRLRPFWSVFGELPRRYFGVPLLREIQGRTVIFPECPSLEANNSAGTLPPASIPPEFQSREVAVPCPFTRFAIPERQFGRV